jgi:hypothetical protein
MEQDRGKTEFEYLGNDQTGSHVEAVTDTPKQKPLIQWNASEFIHHQKNTGWFFPLVIASIVLIVGIFFLTKDILATLVILLGCVTFGMYARQKPRTLTYTLLPTSIKIGNKNYSYDDFKTFSIVQEGPLYSIFLQPIKRFMPPISIYFDPDDGEKIFDTLASHLPHEERSQDPIEKLMQKIRF